MKILKNLLGDQSKIHGDSIYIEHGSNDDGYWVKLPEGTLICMRTYLVDRNVGSSGSAETVPLPAFFQSNSMLFADFAANASGGAFSNIANLSDVHVTASSEDWQIRASVNTKTLNQTLVLFAIGR